MGAHAGAGAVVLDGVEELELRHVGGKAWSVNHLRRLGLPVPPAFALGIDLCRVALEIDSLPSQAEMALAAGMAYLEKERGERFGDPDRPLLVSVRSGAARSMPGMMDTVLNVGLTERVASAIAHRRGRDHADDLRGRLEAQFLKVVGEPPPDDAYEQLKLASMAVFRSWNSPRAEAYRRHHGLSEAGGTAVTVQAMVLGNIDDRSGTGVMFSRNPLSGLAAPMGEWLPMAQGEDVVSGRVTPLPLAALSASMPSVYAELLDASTLLERDRTEVQDIEFTVESGRLWLLQSRAAKLSREARLRSAVAMVRESLITIEEALSRLEPEDVSSLLSPHLDPAALETAQLVASGEPACSGVAGGLVANSADEAEELAAQGHNVVLVTETTNPDDVHGMVASVAVVTELGGATSHAAVVSRELGRPCVVGCGRGSLAALGGREVTVDGASGRIYDGLLPIIDPADAGDKELAELLRWLDFPDMSQLADALRARSRQEDRR